MPVSREVGRCLAAIRAHNGFLNAFVALRPTESLLKEAALSNERLMASEITLPLFPILHIQFWIC